MRALPGFFAPLSVDERCAGSNRRAHAVAFLLLALLALAILISPLCAPGETVPRTVAASATERQARIKDISSIEGIRDNQLIGYGLVVGLLGTGDSQQTTFPIQTLSSMLLRMGVNVSPTSIRVQNLAAVFVSATLPPFSRPVRSSMSRSPPPATHAASKAACC